MERLKYTSTERVFEGIIVDFTDGGVTIDLKGRLGQLKMPRRMLITNYEVKIGQEVAFLMSYPEVLSDVPNQKYVDIVNENAKRRLEAQNKEG